MSKKKNQYFDVKLYKEGFCQLRIPGVVSGAILLLCGILVPMMYAIESYEINSIRTQGLDMHTLDLLSVNGLLWICPYILAPLMTILLFRFLNQRNSSDFYHSIPQTRKCVAISFLAAVVTWVMILLVGIGLFGCLFAELLPYVSVDWNDVFQRMLHLLTASILAVGGTFLAVSMTGTVFTNFAVAAMLLCVPTLLAMVLEANVVERLPFVYSIDEVLVYKYNNLTNIFREMMGMDDQRSQLVSALYTTLLGVIYGGVGVYMYQERISEAAGKAASSRWLKAVFRVTPAFVLTLIPITMIYLNQVSDGGEVFYLVIMYVVAVVVYFLYELFSTGKWKSALLSLKGLWLLAALNIAALLILNGVTLYAENCIPAAQDIVSVRFIENGYDYYGGSLNETELDSEEVRTFVSDTLKQTVQGSKENNLWGNFDSRKTVAIETKWGTMYRHVYITYTQEKELSGLMASSEEYQKVYQSLPDLKEWEMYTDREWKDEDSASRIHQVLEEEIKNMEFSKWYDYINGDVSEHWINLAFNKRTGRGYLNVPVSLYVLPDTYRQCIEEMRVETDPKLMEKLSPLFGKVSRQETGCDFYYSVTNVKWDRFVGDGWVSTPMVETEEQKDTGSVQMETEGEVVYFEAGLLSYTEVVTVQTEAIPDKEAYYDTSAYTGHVLEKIFAREPMTEGEYILQIYGDIYDGEEWFYVPDIMIYITSEEAYALKRGMVQ